MISLALIARLAHGAAPMPDGKGFIRHQDGTLSTALPEPKPVWAPIHDEQCED